MHIYLSFATTLDGVVVTQGGSASIKGSGQVCRGGHTPVAGLLEGGGIVRLDSRRENQHGPCLCRHLQTCHVYSSSI